MCNRLILLLIITILAGCKTPPASPPSVEVIQPEFKIVSIIIIQADLVNTQFETVLKIDNPNNFDLELNSIKYELHGNGMFWAEGTAQNLVTIRAQDSCETKFRFSMNFINMNRNLLDDIINMRKVQYKFKGAAELKAAVARSEVYSFGFDIAGMSDVKPKAE